MFRINGLIDLQELIPAGDRNRPTKFYTWSKQNNAKIPVGTFEAAVEGPVHDLKAFLEFGKSTVMRDGLSIGAGDVTPEMEREWQSFLAVMNDHFRHTMDNFAHKTDYGKAFTDVPRTFEVGIDDPGNPEKNGIVNLVLHGPDGNTFSTDFFDSWGDQFHIADRRSEGDETFRSRNDQQGISTKDRYWDSLLESGVELPTSHPAIQQRFSGIERGNIVKRDVSGSYQTYALRPSQGGQPISGSVPWSRNQGGDYTQLGQSLSGEQATPTDTGIPGELPATTGDSTAVPLAEALTAPVSPADVRWEDTLNDGVARPVDTRPVGEAILGQGNTVYVDGVGAVEIGPDGRPQLNATQTSMARLAGLKSYLRSKIGDHPFIDQFADLYLGSGTVAPLTPVRTLREWAIQQQLWRILEDRGIIRDGGPGTVTGWVSGGEGGMASPVGGVGTPGSLQDIISNLDPTISSSLNILDSMGELGNLALPDVGIDDLNLPEVGVGDLGLPGIGVGDLGLPNINVSDLGLPGVGLGDLGLPNITVGDLGLPGVGVGDLGLPDVSVGDLGLPDVSVGDLGLPAVGVGDLGLPAVGVGDLGLPDVGVGDLGLPGVGVGDLGLPSIGVGDLGLPAVGLGDLGLPAVGVGDLGLPAVGVGDLGLPGVGLGDLGLPNVTLADLGLPDVTLADLGLPNIDLAALGLPDISVADLNIPSLAGLTSGINILEQRLRTLNLPSLEALTTGIGDLSAAVSGLDTAPLAGLTSGIDTIERRLRTLNIPQLQPLLDAISGAESRIGALDVPSLSGLSGLIGGLEQRLGQMALPDWTGLTPQDFGLSSNWLGGLTGAIGGLEQRVGQMGLPDFSGTSLADLGLNLTAGDMGTALKEYFGGVNPLTGISDSLTALLGKDFGGGDIYNEYITNVTGGGAGFDPIAFGRGLAGGTPDDPYHYLNMGFLDLLKQAQAQGIVGPGSGGLSPDALRTGLGQFFFGTGWDQLAPTIDPDKGIWNDLPMFGPGVGLDAFEDWGSQFRTGLGLAPGQTMQDLISGLIPNQPEVDPLFSNPELFFGELTDALIKAHTATTPTFTDGSVAPTSWYSGTDGTAGTTPPTKPPVHEIPLPPALEMPAIPDFREYLQYPLMEGLTGALGENVKFGVNPYDVRRDAILEGPTSAINEQFDEARENLVNRFGTMGMMGSPAFSEQMRKLERDRAQQVSNIASQFGLAAAAQDEPIRRGRLQDLAGGLRGERDFVRDELKFQTDMDALQKGQYDQFITSQIANWMAPLNYDDEGKRLALGGIGSNVNPNIGGALGALGDIFAAAGGQIGSNNRSLFGAFGGGGGQTSLWGS